MALDERARAVVIERVTSTTGRAPGSFEVFVERGTEYAEIVRRAEGWRATLVVVGSHGRAGAAQDGRLGGVATKVVRYAHCPVLVARPSAHRGLVVLRRISRRPPCRRSRQPLSRRGCGARSSSSCT